MVDACTHFDDRADMLAEISADLGEPMVGINLSTLPKEELLANRGW